MMFSFLHLVSAFILSLILLFVSLLFGSRYSLSRNKNTPFECGFDPKDSGRLPFSMRFFLLGIVFLIFDIEVALLFPMIVGMKYLVLSSVYLGGFMFLLILLGGLIHEWNQGSLSWVI